MDKIKIDGELYLGFIGGYLILLNTRWAVVIVYIKPMELLRCFLAGLLDHTGGAGSSGQPEPLRDRMHTSSAMC